MRPILIDPKGHSVCAISGALGLIAGKSVYVPAHAYPRRSPTKIERLLQVTHGISGLLATSGCRRTLVTGEQLAYRNGRIDYFSENLVANWRSFGKVTRPFFVLSGGEPAQTIAAITGCDPDPLPQLQISKIHCTVVVMANRGGVPVVIHYAVCDNSISELERTAEGLRLASADEWIAPLCARLLEHRRISNGAALLAQTRIPASPYEFNWRRIDAANDLWLSYPHAGTNSAKPFLDERLQLVCDGFSEFRDMLAPLSEALSEWCESRDLRAGLVHGDFWLGNVLFQDQKIVSIIDWEWAHREGIPLMDILNMLLRSPALDRDSSFAEVLRQFWTDELTDTELTSRLQSLSVRANFGSRDLKFLGLAIWFDILWQRAIRGVVESKAWMEDMIPRTAKVALEWLNTH